MTVPMTPTAVVAEVSAVLISLRGVFDPGEPVDEFDHAMQSAGRAIDDGADDELVVATLLHDVGRSPLISPFADLDRHAGHDAVARRWLAPRFGRRVAWLAGMHVAAKRYLVATEPGYADGLSAVSRESLAAQGGADADAAERSHPWWPDAVRLRRFDDAAKTPGAAVPNLDVVLATVARVARAARFEQVD